MRLCKLPHASLTYIWNVHIQGPGPRSIQGFIPIIPSIQLVARPCKHKQHIIRTMDKLYHDSLMVSLCASNSSLSNASLLRLLVKLLYMLSLFLGLWPFPDQASGEADLRRRSDWGFQCGR